MPRHLTARVLAPLVAIATLAGLARAIDPSPVQVHVETRFLTVQQSELTHLGIRWMGPKAILEGMYKDDFLTDAGQLQDEHALGLGSLMTDDAVNGLPCGLGAIGQLELGSKDIEKAIQAAEKDKKIKVIERPLITFINRQRAAVAALQGAPNQFPKGAGGLNRKVNAHYDSLYTAEQRLSWINNPTFYGGIPFLGAFTPQGGRNFLDRQGFEVVGDGKVKSKRQHRSKERFLSLQGKGNQPGHLQVRTRGIFPTDATVAVDLGIFLKVTPKVIAGSEGRIVMQIDAVNGSGEDTGNYVRVVVDQLADGQRSAFVETQDMSPTAIQLPAIQTSPVITQVLVMDGQTVALGGLFEERDASSRTEVPLLGNVPFIGNFFRAAVRAEGVGKKNARGFGNLLIFVTPQIVPPKR